MAMYSKILVPMDGAEVTAAMLEQIVILTRACGARLFLLTVGCPLPAVLPDANEVQLTLTFQAEASLEKIREYFTAQGLEVTTTVCLGEPAQAILDFAERQQVDLIVMHSRDGAGTPWPFLGSVAAKVVVASTIPVMVYHATAATRPVP